MADSIQCLLSNDYNLVRLHRTGQLAMWLNEGNTHWKHILESVYQQSESNQLACKDPKPPATIKT
jgi:hypothetical protein